MNGRRGFMKCLVGALVASAIEIRLAAAPVLEAVSPVFDPMAYVGEFRWIQEVVEKVWVERYRQALSELAERSQV